MEGDGRVNDFRVYDTADGFSYAPFDGNTGKWAYSAESAYLVRHRESVGNNPSLILEVWEKSGKNLKLAWTLELPDNEIAYLQLNSTGQWLSYGCGGQCKVIRLEDCVDYVSSAFDLYYEDGMFHGRFVGDNQQYHFADLGRKELLQKAEAFAAGNSVVRSLTEEELAKYNLKEQ